MTGLVDIAAIKITKCVREYIYGFVVKYPPTNISDNREIPRKYMSFYLLKIVVSSLYSLGTQNPSTLFITFIVKCKVIHILPIISAFYDRFLVFLFPVLSTFIVKYESY